MCGPHVAQNRLNLTSAHLWRTISPYPGLLARFQSEAARGARRADLATHPFCSTHAPRQERPTPWTHPPCAVVESLESSRATCSTSKPCHVMPGVGEAQRFRAPRTTRAS